MNDDDPWFWWALTRAICLSAVIIWMTYWVITGDLWFR